MKIISTVPAAPDWAVVYVSDGEESFCPVVAWATVREEDVEDRILAAYVDGGEARLFDPEVETEYGPIALASPEQLRDLTHWLPIWRAWDEHRAERWQKKEARST
jgi:hypothetical protein